MDDVKKIREAFLPIVDLDETSIEFKEGDFIKYNKETGMIDFYPADKNQKSGHAEQSSGGVMMRESKPEDIAKEPPYSFPVTDDVEENTKAIKKQDKQKNTVNESGNIKSNNIAK